MDEFLKYIALQKIVFILHDYSVRLIQLSTIRPKVCVTGRSAGTRSGAGRRSSTGTAVFSAV